MSDDQIEKSPLQPTEPQQSSYDYYLQQAKSQLDSHSRDFSVFAKDREKLIGIGDEMLKKRQATGYNVLLSESDMPLRSGEKLIFYNNYIGRPQHFALLLSEMEEQGIITRDQVSFGLKGSKVLYQEGSWTVDPNDETQETIEREDGKGGTYPQTVNRTVETVAIFKPTSDEQALRIGLHLLKRTNARFPNHIDGSWEVPDIRATEALKRVMLVGGLKEVVANIYKEEDGAILVARQETQLTQPWQPTSMEMHPELASYLASSEFGVEP